MIAHLIPFHPKKKCQKNITLPAFMTVNAFASYALTSQVTVSVAVNNLLDKIGYTESNDGRGAARSINGRTAKATLKYNF